MRRLNFLPRKSGRKYFKQKIIAEQFFFNLREIILDVCQSSASLHDVMTGPIKILTKHGFRSVKNSLTFFKLNIFYPDIISSQNLIRELTKISQLNPDRLLFPVQLETLMTYEISLSTTCMLLSNKILFFISVAIFKITLLSFITYYLYYLFLTPSYVKDELVLLKPKYNYVIQIINY